MRQFTVVMISWEIMADTESGVLTFSCPHPPEVNNLYKCHFKHVPIMYTCIGQCESSLWFIQVGTAMKFRGKVPLCSVHELPLLLGRGGKLLLPPQKPAADYPHFQYSYSSLNDQFNDCLDTAWTSESAFSVCVSLGNPLCLVPLTPWCSLQLSKQPGAMWKFPLIYLFFHWASQWPIHSMT